MIYEYFYYFLFLIPFLIFFKINYTERDKLLLILFILFIFVLNYNNYFNLYFFSYDNWKGIIFVFMFFIYIIINNISNYFELEEWLLGFIVLLGAFVVITCDHFLILYLGLELQTFSIFILISKNKIWLKSSEAGLKYFILGALSSGLFLLGIVLLFIKGYSLSIESFTTGFWYQEKILIISFLFIILSLFFKISLFPLHFWIPDIYEGSSWKTLGLIGTLPKISVIYLLIQFSEMIDLFIICSLLSIIIGTLGALNQTKLKRLLAYSGISHMGFMILIIGILNQKGFTINNIYLLIYILSLISIIILVSKTLLSNNNYLIELGNNNYVNRIIALSWIILLLSIAGIPPLSGFLSKWLVLWTILEENYIISTIICITFSAIAAGYYLRLIKIVYFQKNSSYILWKSILLPESKISSTNFYFLGLFIYIIIFFILKPSPLLIFFNTSFNYIN
uniref:NADH dehydrogenase subunit 2 n=1 Tax=Apolemia rubriversa TaxID=1390100 RepID=UPI0026E4940E|nr:NADH dehydrogenase subunit 2 [Apolemia rubriversa]WJJ70043.1 NADH dehydrogenase subunit 2 [Apolemia rubriversa]